MVLTRDALAHLVFLILAVALTLFGEWKLRRGGPRALWRDWGITATLLAGAFAWASPAIYGPTAMHLSPLWTPVPVAASAGLLHLGHRRRVPTGLRLVLTALLFFALQTFVRVIA